MAAAVPSSDMSPGGSSRIMEQAVDDVKPWDQFFQTEPPLLDQSALEDGWSLLHEGRLLEDGLVASAAELVSDLLWGNLALPINKCLDKLRRIDALLCDDAPADMSYLAEMSARIERSVTGEPAAGATDGLSDDQRQEEALLRRECRELLELSTAQLEEMHEKKGEFGQAYRVVAAAWYMMMLPSTTLRSPLIAPDDASKAAWDAMEKEYERRRVEGTRWRTAREDETVFDDEAARRHPYEMTQTRRRHELTITVPVPARTRACDVRVSLQKRQLRITVATHPLSPVVAGELYSAIRASESGGDWHLEGEFETRRLVLDLDKESLADWPCLLLADAPEGALRRAPIAPSHPMPLSHRPCLAPRVQSPSAKRSPCSRARPAKPTSTTRRCCSGLSGPTASSRGATRRSRPATAARAHCGAWCRAREVACRRRWSRRRRTGEQSKA